MPELAPVISITLLILLIFRLKHKIMPNKVELLKDFTERLNDITEPGKKKLILRDEFVIQGVI
jgi:hypothetical protein